VFFTVFTTLVLMAFTTAVFLMIGAVPLSALLFKAAKFERVIKLMAIASAIQIVAVLPMTLLKLQSRSVFYTVATLSQFTVNLVATVYLVARLNQNVEGIYTAQIIGWVIYFIILSKYIFKNFSLKFEWIILKEMLVYSFPLMLSMISSIVLTIADRFCINFITGLSELGVYSLGYKIANSIKVLLVTSVQLAISPMIFQMMSRPDNQRFYSKLLTYFCYGITICVLAVSVFSREIVQLLATRNPDYWGAHKVIPILSLAVLFGMCRDTALTGLNLTKKTKIIGTVTVLISVLNLILNVFFIYLFDAIGASFAALLSNLLFFLVIYHYAQKSYYIPYEIKKIATMIGLAICLYLIAWAITPFPGLIEAGIKLILLVLWPILLYFFNFYEPIEIQTLKGAWRKWRNPLKWKKNISRTKFDK
jgi:O-antigen/teichoic acid export membrane protein